MGETNIEWTDRVWNPIRGCSRVSAGCMHCYAEVMAARFAKQWGTPEIVRPDGGWSGVLSLVESKLTEPLSWRDPRKVFVNSMSDLFHEKVPDEWIDQVFAVMALSPQHTFQILTKRPERMRAYLSETRRNIPVYNAATAIAGGDFSKFPGDMAKTRSSGGSWWPLPNVWLGVSVEDQATADARIPLLLQTPAVVRFVSYEPALAGVDFTRIEDGVALTIDALRGTWEIEHSADYPHHGGGLEGGEMPARLDLVIIGGESGPRARPFDVAWARSTIAQCRAASVPVFCKQLGSAPAVSGAEADPSHPTFKALEFGLRDRKGGDPSEWPKGLDVREFPAVRDA